MLPNCLEIKHEISKIVYSQLHSKLSLFSLLAKTSNVSKRNTRPKAHILVLITLVG